MSALFHMPFRVKTPTADLAVEQAKTEARAGGWVVRTLVRCRQEANGDWIVTLAVYAAEKGVPA